MLFFGIDPKDFFLFVIFHQLPGFIQYVLLWNLILYFFFEIERDDLSFGDAVLVSIGGLVLDLLHTVCSESRIGRHCFVDESDKSEKGSSSCYSPVRLLLIQIVVLDCEEGSVAMECCEVTSNVREGFREKFHGQVVNQHLRTPKRRPLFAVLKVIHSCSVRRFIFLLQGRSAFFRPSVVLLAG